MNSLNRREVLTILICVSNLLPILPTKLNAQNDTIESKRYKPVPPFPTKLNAQNDTIESIWIRVRPELLKKVFLKDIYDSDTKGIIDRNFYTWNDSINTCSWNSEFWFYLKRSDSERNDDIAVELFAYRDSVHCLWQVTNHELAWHGAYTGTFDNFFLFRQKMFILKFEQKRERIGHVQILVVNPSEHNISKVVDLRESSRWFQGYIKDNKLIIEVQPLHSKLNILFYIFFWGPKDIRGPKWEYIETGNRWRYVLDESFNIIEEYEVK